MERLSFLCSAGVGEELAGDLGKRLSGAKVRARMRANASSAPMCRRAERVPIA